MLGFKLLILGYIINLISGSCYLKSLALCNDVQQQEIQMASNRSAGFFSVEVICHIHVYLQKYVLLSSTVHEVEILLPMLISFRTR